MAELLDISETHLPQEGIQVVEFQIPGKEQGETDTGQEAEGISLNQVLLS